MYEMNQTGTLCKAARLRTEYLVNPLGIDAVQPRLSWIVECSRRGVRQSAYRILVSSNERDLSLDIGDLWDSGKTISPGSNQVPYAGSILQSGQECFWKVKIWDEADHETEWSAPAKWSMGLLHRGDWVGKWIGLRTKRGDVGRPCTFLRKMVKVEKSLSRAVIYATALGVYELSLNGVRVGEDYFTPEWTDYNVRVLYQTYDVTSYLKEGFNAIGSILGDGWYAGHIGWYGPDQYGIFPRFYMQMHLYFTDGTCEIISTDSDWKASLGPIVYSDLQMGERYDARLEQPLWNRPEFDDSAWGKPEVFFDYQGWFTAQSSQRIRVTETREPVSIKYDSPGTLIADIGQNLVGWIQFSFTCRRETELRLRYGETLNPDGSLYTENLRDARQTDYYHSKGAGEVVYEPKFTFHGFRYVEITFEPDDAEINGIVAKVIHNDTPRTGRVVTSSPIVNQLASNIIWTQRANFISVPTDCPQRDERLGWTGDAQIYACTAAFNMDVIAFFGKFIADMEDAQRKTGAFTDTAPFVKGTPDWAPMIASAGWADAGVIIPWTMYRMYGDIRLLDKHYEAMTKWVDYVHFLNPSLLRKDTQYYGDWLSLEADTPMEVFATAYFAYSVKLLAEIADALGKSSDSVIYHELFEAIRRQFNKAFVSADGKIRGETQTCYALALYMGLLPEELRKQAAEHLVKDIERRGYHISTGIHGIKYLLPVLCDNGYPDVAYRLLLQETYPSWGYSIKQGATTIWERWDGWTEETGFQNWRMNSFNHYALGSVGEWFYRYMAGIQVLEDTPGFGRFRIRPYIGAGLEFVECDFDSIHGLIRSSWKRTEHVLEMQVTIPANTSAVVHVPSANGNQVYESGTVVPVSSDIIVTAINEMEWILEVPSGSYRFQTKMPSEV